MRQAQYPILQRIGKVLHEQLSDVAREPLPEQWTDLINYLNDEERVRRESSSSDKAGGPGHKP
jgi:hypothetical protein